MWFRDSCLTCDGILNHTGIPFYFWQKYWFNHTRILLEQMGEGYAAIQGGGRSLMTHNAGSVTKYSIQICDGFWNILVYLIGKTGRGKFVIFTLKKEWVGVGGGGAGEGLEPKSRYCIVHC